MFLQHSEKDARLIYKAMMNSIFHFYHWIFVIVSYGGTQHRKQALKNISWKHKLLAANQTKNTDRMKFLNYITRGSLLAFAILWANSAYDKLVTHLLFIQEYRLWT